MVVSGFAADDAAAAGVAALFLFLISSHSCSAVEPVARERGRESESCSEAEV